MAEPESQPSVETRQGGGRRGGDLVLEPSIPAPCGRRAAPCQPVRVSLQTQVTKAEPFLRRNGFFLDATFHPRRPLHPHQKEEN